MAVTIVAEADREAKLEANIAEKPGPQDTTSSISPAPSTVEKAQPPWQWKLTAVVLAVLIRFGGAWSSGITSPLKSTLKKELHINNTTYALLDSTDDFVKSVLILLTGYMTDRYGGAAILFYGNGVYSLGSVLLAAAAQTRSIRFMIGARVIMALGDCSTQVAQFQVFSSWFAPNDGFATTLGLELMFQKLGGLAGAGTANVITKVS